MIINKSKIKRFINLIDVNYDNNIRVFFSSERPEKALQRIFD